MGNRVFLIVIVALIATTAFYRQARNRNLPPGKAASIPFMAACWVLIFANVATFLLAKIASQTSVPVSAVRLMMSVFNWSLLIAYLWIIRRNWHALIVDEPSNEP